MKNKILFSAMLLFTCAVSMNVNAQLEVQTSGDVKITKNAAVGTDVNNNISLNVERSATSSLSPYYGIKSLVSIPSQRPQSSPLYGLYSAAEATLASSGTGTYAVVGVYGAANKSIFIPTAFSAGVVGIVPPVGSGYGVFGGVGSLPSSMGGNAKYAGYFNGKVKVTGTLYTSVILINNDTVYAKNAQPITSIPRDEFAMLRPISYTLQHDSTWIVENDAEKEIGKTHYGLVAQDVQKVYPDLVYEDAAGNLSINYIEMIPLLIQQVQDLSAEVEDLRKQINSKTNK